MADEISLIMADLTGQQALFPKDLETSARTLLDQSGLGYSQFNELLLLLGYDRVTPEFFQFLIDGTIEYQYGNALKSLEQFRAGVERFRILAIRSFGNIKFGFKYLSAPTTNLFAEIGKLGKVEETRFSKRHEPLAPIELIPAEKTYYLGYLIERLLLARLKENPNDAEAKAQLEERRLIVEQGKRNQEAYLASDHMDVYVATSMRERHEFQIIGQVIDEVFGAPLLKSLNLRWFDPTQAYCVDRIDKGLAEALMLKRAQCTLYLAQESDTLGKDSELASTLAQGKPVIAYVPRVEENKEEEFVNRLLQMVREASPGTPEARMILDQLRVFAPDAAWKDQEVIAWINSPTTIDLAVAKKKLGGAIRKHYDGRASGLKETHPLGIQVHLQTGVANGVLVARTPAECASLIYQILTGTLEFRIEPKEVENRRYLLLREKSTDSVFRVVTGDNFLTNAFWNFYLAK